MDLPGIMFDALDEAATYLEGTAVSNAITVAGFHRLVDNAYADKDPSADAYYQLDQIKGWLRKACSSMTEEEHEWRELEEFKRCPGIRYIPKDAIVVTPKDGIGNG
jgi:hypothetical protein